MGNRDDADNLVEFPGDLDPAQFRVSGTDSKGHSNRVWANIQPVHLNAIDILVQSNNFPYRTRGDLIRHALIRHMHWLERIHKPLNSVTGAVNAMNAMLRDAEFRSEFVEMIGKIVKQVEDLVNEEDIPAARKLLLNIMRELATMPDGYWKDKYEKTLREHPVCMKILQNLPNASLSSFGKEEREQEKREQEKREAACA